MVATTGLASAGPTSARVGPLRTTTTRAGSQPPRVMANSRYDSLVETTAEAQRQESFSNSRRTRSTAGRGCSVLHSYNSGLRSWWSKTNGRPSARIRSATTQNTSGGLHACTASTRVRSMIPSSRVVTAIRAQANSAAKESTPEPASGCGKDRIAVPADPGSVVSRPGPRGQITVTR